MKVWNRFCFCFSEEKMVGVGVGAHVFRHQTWQTTPSEQMEWGFHRLTDWLRPASLQPATTGYGLSLSQKLQDHVIPLSILVVANSNFPSSPGLWRTKYSFKELMMYSTLVIAESMALMTWSFLRLKSISRGCNSSGYYFHPCCFREDFTLDWIACVSFMLLLCPKMMRFELEDFKDFFF